jgi:hypothetical protein
MVYLVAIYKKDLEDVTSRCIFTGMTTKKSNIITIDLDVWTTQTQKAKSRGLNESTIRQRVSRTKQGKGLIKEEFWDIPELNLTLVKKA